MSNRFTYRFYRQLIRQFKDADYVFVSPLEAVNDTSGGYRVLWLHDVDLSILNAGRIAEIDREEGIVSTFMLFGDPVPVYTYQEDGEIIRGIFKKHSTHLGLHVNSRNRIIEGFKKEIRDMERVSGRVVTSYNFHRSHSLMMGKYGIEGLINTSEIYSSAYYADSGGGWRFGHPLSSRAFMEKRSMRILTHPCWYGDQTMSAVQRLKEVAGQFKDVDKYALRMHIIKELVGI